MLKTEAGAGREDAVSQRQSLALTEVTTHTQGTPFLSQGAPFSSLSTSSFASGGIEAQITCSSICCLEGHQIITLPWMCLETGNTPLLGLSAQSWHLMHQRSDKLRVQLMAKDVLL